MPEAPQAFPEVTLTVKPDPLSRRKELVIAAQVTDPADGQTYAFQGHVTARGRDDYQVREILAIGRSVLEATTRRAMSIRRGPEPPPGEPPPEPEPPSPEILALRAEAAGLRLLAAQALDGWQSAAHALMAAEGIASTDADLPPVIGSLRLALGTAAGPETVRDLRELVNRHRQACEAEGALNMESYPPGAKVDRVEAAIERWQTRLFDALGVPRRAPRIRQVSPPPAPEADTVQLPPPAGAG